MKKKLNQNLGLTENENLNSTNRLVGWAQYEFKRAYGRAYGYDYLFGMIEFWLGSDPVETKYSVLNLTHERPEIENLGFFELMDLIKSDGDMGGYMSIYSEGYQKIIHINDFGYYWKNF